jgi:hypothetical protein
MEVCEQTIQWKKYLSRHTSYFTRPTRFNLILDTLKGSRGPLLLVLDNFETAWHSERVDHEQISKILLQISSVQHLSLVVTMRGIEKPHGVKWDKLEELGVLTLDAARKVFLSIADECAATSGLDDLLRDVDYIPLAVTLLAWVSQTGDESVDDLHYRWREEKTKLLNRGAGRDANIETSIELSLGSRLMKDCPAALQLLSNVCELPAGISNRRGDISAQTTIPEGSVSRAVHTLKQLSLAHTSTLSSSHLTTLSPIRAYMRHYRRSHNRDLDLLRQWHLSLAHKGDCQPGDPEFCENVDGLTPNQENISYILREMIDSRNEGEKIVTAVLHFSKFLYWTKPSDDLLRYLLEAAQRKRFVIPTKVKPKLLHRLGNIMRTQSDYDGARSALEEARTEFKCIGKRLGAAQCLQSLGDIMRMQSDYEGARSALEEARTEFESIGKRLGAAQCRRSIGDIMRMQSDYEGARSALEEARTEFESIGNRLGAAQCLQSLGDIMLMQSDYGGGTICVGRSEVRVRVHRESSRSCSVPPAHR